MSFIFGGAGTATITPISLGGTGQSTATAAFNALSPITTKGDLISFDGTNDVRLPVGTNGQVLSADSAEASGLKWITFSSSPTLANKAIGYGNASNVLTGVEANLSFDLTGSLTAGKVFRCGTGVMSYMDYVTGANAEFLAMYNVSGTFNFQSSSAGSGTINPIRFKVNDTVVFFRNHTSTSSHVDIANTLGNSTLTSSSAGFCRIAYTSTAGSGVANACLIDGTSLQSGSGQFNACRIVFNDSTSLTADQNILQLVSGSTINHSFSGIDGNIYFHRNNAAESAGGGVRVMFIGNAGTTPTSNPTGGAILYAESGVLKVRQSDGTTVTIGSGGGSTVKDIRVFSYKDHEPPASNSATLNTLNARPCLEFDTTTQQTTIFSGRCPRTYSGGNIIVSLLWAAASATSGTIGWDVSFERIASGDNLGSDSFATAQTVTAATVPGTAGICASSSVTITAGAATDSLAAGDYFRLRVRRDVANDTAAGYAQLFDVEVREA